MSSRSLSTTSQSSRDLALSVAETGSRASSGHSELASPKLPPVLRCVQCVLTLILTSDCRVATWCCDGVASQTDSLDLMLYNEGQPLDILLLQSTQGPCPIMGNTDQG